MGGDARATFRISRMRRMISGRLRLRKSEWGPKEVIIRAILPRYAIIRAYAPQSLPPRTRARARVASWRNSPRG